MTASERIIANHLLAEVEKGLPDGPSAARSAFDLLRKHLSAGAVLGPAPVAKPVKRRRRRRKIEAASAVPQTD